VLSILLGIIFEDQNVAFMVGLAFAIAASANFPVLVLSISWRGCTTRGAVMGGFIGLVVATLWVVLSKTVLLVVFCNSQPILPCPNSAVVSIPLAFIATSFFSITARTARADRVRAACEALTVRSQSGIGRSGAVAH